MDKKIYRLFGLMMALPFQCLVFFIGAFYFGEFLNEQYPKSYDWKNICMAFAFILTIQSFYVVIKYVIKESKRG